MDARLAHPAFDAVRPWFARLQALGGPSLANLNQLARAAALRTESDRPVRFVAPSASDRYYEAHVFESGCVQTRPESRHDLFNALAWLAFPRTKARINAMHAEQIPLESGRRGRLRDLLTIFDEGGAIVRCNDAALIAMVRDFRWRELFWEHRDDVVRSMHCLVLGHAVLEMALEPWPGIACKALFVADGVDADAQAAAWLRALPAAATPRELAPLPIFGFPGWDSANRKVGYYEDQRYFRPFRRDMPHQRTLECPQGVGQAAAVHNTEESPGSAERDAG